VRCCDKGYMTEEERAADIAAHYDINDEAKVERLQDTADDLHGRLILSEAEVERLTKPNLLRDSIYQGRIDHLEEVVERLRGQLAVCDESHGCALVEVERLKERDAVTQEMWGKAEEEVKRLKAENDQLRARLGDPFEIDRLKKEVERLKAANQEFASEHVRMYTTHCAEVERLTRRLNVLVDELERTREELWSAHNFTEAQKKRLRGT